MKKLTYILVTVLMIIFPGCKESWLDLENPNMQTSASFWKTESDIQKGVNGTYMALYYDGAFLRFAPFALDARGDDMLSASPWDVLANTGSFKLANSTIMQEWLWVAFFGGVNRANQVLYNIHNVTFSDQTYKSRLKGEALFLRGLNNYYLVTFFNNIPLITKWYENTDEWYPVQAKPEEVWAQIISDFKEASELLPVSYKDPDVGRATKGAALGFLGKCYLFNKNWSEAATVFKQVIDLKENGVNVYGLVYNYEDNFTDLHENNKESVFEIQFSREAGGTNMDDAWVGEPADRTMTTAHAITIAPTPFGWGDATPTQWIFDEFQQEKTIDGKDDPRLRATILYSYPGSTLYGQLFDTVYKEEIKQLAIVGKKKFACKKYTNSYSNRTDEKDWRSGINERVMRYADILLMYAECQNELANQAECAKYIQMVRNRAKLSDREAEFAQLSQSAMRERIAHERALEFALEGHRFDDIRRWGWLQNPEKLNELKAHDSEFNGYVPGREYFSIPQREIEVNPKLIQNPGY